MKLIHYKFHSSTAELERAMKIGGVPQDNGLNANVVNRGV
jgi:hypothetical protein